MVIALHAAASERASGPLGGWGASHHATARAEGAVGGWSCQASRHPARCLTFWETSGADRESGERQRHAASFSWCDGASPLQQLRPVWAAAALKSSGCRYMWTELSGLVDSGRPRPFVTIASLRRHPHASVEEERGGILLPQRRDLSADIGRAQGSVERGARRRAKRRTTSVERRRRTALRPEAVERPRPVEVGPVVLRPEKVDLSDDVRRRERNIALGARRAGQRRRLPAVYGAAIRCAGITNPQAYRRWRRRCRGLQDGQRRLELSWSGGGGGGDGRVAAREPRCRALRARGLAS